MRRTALFDHHLAAGAKLVEFAGWEMPVQYAGVRAEHMAVREGVGIFDVSHMGEIETSGPDALALLQLLLSNDISAIPVGGAQYSVLCRGDGGVLDDLFTYRIEADRYLTVTNAANHAGDLAWFRAHAGDLDVEVHDRLEDYAMLAVQGPRAREVVQAISDSPLPPRMRAAERRIGGATVLVCGTGYTGEDGVELLLPPAHAARLWDELVHRGATPVGLAARDTLRLEVCFHLYGNDLMVERGPIEAGLGWCCKEDTGFIGADAVRAARGGRGPIGGPAGSGPAEGGPAGSGPAEGRPAGSGQAEDGPAVSGPSEQLVAFTIDGPGIARQGNAIDGGGVVTSGTLSPSLGVGIGLAYVPSAHAAAGTRLLIDVRGKIRPAVVRAKPLYRKGEPPEHPGTP
jgi:aminomethyltransferase